MYRSQVVSRILDSYQAVILMLKDNESLHFNLKDGKIAFNIRHVSYLWVLTEIRFVFLFLIGGHRPNNLVWKYSKAFLYPSGSFPESGVKKLGMFQSIGDEADLEWSEGKREKLDDQQQQDFDLQRKKQQQFLSGHDMNILVIFEPKSFNYKEARQKLPNKPVRVTRGNFLRIRPQKKEKNQENCCQVLTGNGQN